MRAASLVMSVEMSARVDLLQALDRRSLCLIVRATDFKRTQPGVVDRRLFNGGDALVESFSALLDLRRRKARRRFELPRRRSNPGGIGSLISGRQSLVKPRNRGRHPVL